MNIEKEIIEVRIDDIIPNRFQPREKFDEKDLNELAQSIRQHGVINPIVVRKIGDKYEIVAGERRHKASVIAGKDTIPAIVADLDDYESAEIALVENIQRKDLTPIEEAKTYQTILRMSNLTQEQLAQKMGKTQPTVANKLRLLELDEEVQKALLNGKISERHARSLLSIENKEEQKEFLNRIIDNRMTVRDTDLEIKRMFKNDATKEELEVIGDDEETDFDNINGTNEFVEQNITPDYHSNINDIEKIKQQAVDINIPKEGIDVTNLLKSEPTFDVSNKIENPVNDIETVQPNKFISSAEIESKQYDIADIENTTEIKPIGIPFEEQEQIENDNIELTAPSINKNFSHQTETFVTGDLRTAINTIRQCINTIEKYGFSVDSEEFDFEQMYQVIIKINKK